MNNIKLIKNYLLINKKEELNDIDISIIEKVIKEQLSGFDEIAEDTEKVTFLSKNSDGGEDKIFSIFLEKKNSSQNKLEIFYLTDNEYSLELYTSISIEKAFLIFFKRKIKKHIKQIKGINNVTNEIKKFSEQSEAVYLDIFLNK